MNIPFHRAHITQDELDLVSDTIKSGWLTMGPKTIEFEKKFKDFIGSKYSISTNSATSALHLSLNAIGVTSRHEIIVPTNTFVATAEVVAYLGAKPILCDIDYNTHNIDIDQLEKLITSKTKAIIPVHFAGHPCNMDNIINIAKKYNIYVIEDAAHALPTTYKNKMIGTISDITCFSFYATKTLTTGEGGMLTTNNREIAKKVKLQRIHGINSDAWERYGGSNDWYYEVVELGYKYNITDIQSAIGLVQMKKILWMKEQRKQIAEVYKNAFRGKINFINEPEFGNSSWHLFVIKVKNRDYLHKKLKENGISTSVHFIPIHIHPYYKKKYSYCFDNFPFSNKVFEESLSLPIYPGLKTNQIQYIIKNVLKFAKTN